MRHLKPGGRLGGVKPFSSLALTRTWSQCTQRRQRRRRRQRRLTTRVVTCMRAHVTARGACDVTARVIHCFDLLSPSHARGVARSLARSHARHARVMSHRSRARDVTSRVVVSISLLRCLLRAPRVTRVYAYVITAHRARHHRFPSPRARPARARCCGGGARSLARSRARRRRRWVGGGVQLHRASRATRASRASRARASTSSPRITRVITVPLPPTRPHARAATAAALARSIARAVCGGCGGGGGGRWRWRAVTSPVTHVTCAARHARVRLRHHRASRASSPFSVPPRTTGTRALLRRRRSLARSRARRRRRWGWGWRSVTPRVTRVTRERVHVITAHRARHHRPPSPMSPMRTRGSGGGAVSFARLLARAEAEADGHSHVVRVSRVTRARARVILVTALVSATPIEVRSFRRRLVFSSLFSLVFSFFVSPRAHYDETTGDM